MGSEMCIRDRVQRSNVPLVSYPVHLLPQLLIVSPSCAGNTSTSDCHEALSSFTRNALFRQLSGTTFVIASADAPWMSRRSLTLLHMRRTRSELGSYLRTFSPTGPERSARTSGTVTTKLPMDADILLDSADDSPNPPARVERLACAFWWGCSVFRFAGHPSSKNDDSSAVPGSSRTVSYTHLTLPTKA